ncbi:hypothetical protein X801_02234 [Opisthorchis viverrini]|uniref:Uncharacterized protein n=1 Tax=Opisthorchis viverrini TaxID=6198 RepID=A0A1S8X5B9_OPIVI|nr:hypothetical protein X801_02234 [Opisthorchis viverrini]
MLSICRACFTETWAQRSMASLGGRLTDSCFCHKTSGQRHSFVEAQSVGCFLPLVGHRQRCTHKHLISAQPRSTNSPFKWVQTNHHLLRRVWSIGPNCLASNACLRYWRSCGGNERAWTRLVTSTSSQDKLTQASKHMLTTSCWLLFDTHISLNHPLDFLADGVSY